MEVIFEVEDGTGKSDATSYISVDELKQLWYNIGYEFIGISDDVIKRLLNKSTQYLDNTYRNSFPGCRDVEAQSLEWPRTVAYYIDGFDIPEGSVPPEVKSAISEMAHLIQEGNDPYAVISKSGKIISETVQVDVIKEAKRYEEGTSFYQDIYTSIDTILGRITGGVNDLFTLTILRTGGDSP